MTYYTYFKTAAANKALTATDIAAYCLLKALRSDSEDKVAEAKSRLKASFSPITDTNKLANGAKPYQALDTALYVVRVRCMRTSQPAFGLEGVEALTELYEFATSLGRF